MKKYTIGLVVIIAILGLAAYFYWYELRPSSIRKFCAQNTKDKLLNAPAGRTEADYQTNYPFYYKNCLNSKGLNE